MPTWAEAQDEYYKRSAKASDIARQLAFAALALIWLFRSQQADGTVSLDRLLLYAGIFLVAGLAVDLIHAIASSSTIGIYNWWYIRDKPTTTDNTNIDFPRSLVLPVWILWILKFFLIAVSYVFILVFLYQRFL